MREDDGASLVLVEAFEEPVLRARVFCLLHLADADGRSSRRHEKLSALGPGQWVID